MGLDELLRAMVRLGASDLFLKANQKPFMRASGILVSHGQDCLSENQVADLAASLMGPARQAVFHEQREANFAFERPGIGRFRVNAMWQKGTVAMVIRRVNRVIPTFSDLRLPGEVLERLTQEKHGLVLVTGPTDSGKSTTVSSMLQQINRTRPCHIVTLEDPIEFLFEEQRAIVTQREIGADTLSFTGGLKHALRQSPDVLYLSDIRDVETMEAALLAAEAGQLVLTCLHSTNATTTVERIISYFPPHQHALTRLRLSLVLRGLMSIRLLKRREGEGRIPACEILLATPRVREIIREGLVSDLHAVMQDGTIEGMQTFTQALYERYRNGEVELDEALEYADRPEELRLAIQEIRATRDVRSS